MNHEQFPIEMTQNSKHNKWLEMLADKDFPPKLLWRTPTKIHRERKRRRQQKAAKQRDNRLFSTATATSSTQRPQTCIEVGTKYYNYTANEANEDREHQLPTLQKAIRRSSNTCIFTKLIFFDATIGSNSYTMCTMHVKNIFSTD